MSSSPPIPVAVSFEEMATAVPVIACAACKKSHIKCDSGRPCQNCLKNPNKAATCRDAVPKPRGRPKGGSKAAANALREAKLQFEQQFHQQQFQQQMRRQHSHHGLSFSHSRPALAPHSMTPMSRMSPIQTDGFHFSGHPHPALSRSTPTSPAAMDHRPILPGRRPSLPAWRSMCPYNNGHSSPLPGSVPEFADEEQASSPLATAGGAWPAVTAAMSESAMMAPSLCFPSTTSLLATTTAGTAVMMNPSGMLATTPYGMAPTTPGSVATSPNLNHPGLVDGLHAHAAGYSLVDVQAYSPQPMMENPYFAMSHHQQHSHHQSMMSLGMPTSTALHSMHGYYPETPLDAESLESMTDDVTSDDSDESETVDMVAQAGLVYGHAPTAKLPTELHLQMLYSPRPC
ncbi:hypothetical protein BGW38_007171 [Lunasporangiospora selenospora]|uniref:Zn(2)-C6 fungal-type domain-containing protein n=1 Tax=Lunasporangiospora selenospora TaxID=979761 RepID=A0A9P6FLD1_9FUNG|nr:hypothetical protein BGW38_007171 [Lunasporangiospora selenospora]